MPLQDYQRALLAIGSVKMIMFVLLVQHTLHVEIIYMLIIQIIES